MWWRDLVHTRWFLSSVWPDQKHYWIQTLLDVHYSYWQRTVVHFSMVDAFLSSNLIFVLLCWFYIWASLSLSLLMHHCWDSWASWKPWKPTKHAWLSALIEAVHIFDYCSKDKLFFTMLVMKVELWCKPFYLHGYWLYNCTSIPWLCSHVLAWVLYHFSQICVIHTQYLVINNKRHISRVLAIQAANE